MYPNREIWEEGVLAATEGKELNDNPYNDENNTFEEFISWQMGYSYGINSLTI